MIRRLFLLILFLFSSESSFGSDTPTLGERCQHGHRGSEWTYSDGPALYEIGGDTVKEYMGKCRDKYEHSDAGYVCYIKPKVNEPELVGIRYKRETDCAVPETSYPTDKNDAGCYPSDGEGACVPDQGCELPSGNTFFTNQNEQCGDFCEVTQDDGHTFAVEAAEIVNGDNVDGCATSTGPKGDGWDCAHNNFMCTYDTNNDGQISDEDDQSQWPDPNDGLPNGSGCINWGPDACQIVDDYKNGTSSGGGNGSGGDGSGGDGSGGDGSGGDGSGGDGSGGDGGVGGELPPEDDNGTCDYPGDPDCNTEGDGSGGGELLCDSYDSCYEYSKANTPCLDGTRDLFYFEYISLENYAGDCISCNGPSAMTFSECHAEVCQYGYDPASNKCWSEDCKFGDCENPDDDSSKEEVPEPEEKSEDTDRIVGALRDIIQAINNQPSISPSDIQSQTQSLRNKIDELIAGNKELSVSEKAKLDEVIGVLNAIKTNTENSQSSDDTAFQQGLMAKLDSVISEQKLLRCEISPISSECGGTPSEDVVIDHESKADTVKTAIQGSTVVTALNQLRDVNINVGPENCSELEPTINLNAGAISGNFKFEFCDMIQPVESLFRYMFIFLWGFFGIKKIGEA